MEEMFYLHPPTNDAALPTKVYVEPTSMCNLSCSICFRHGWFDERLGRMDMSLFRDLARQVSDMPLVAEVFFGGMGEPLFHPDICEMMSLLPKRCKRSLLTNGTMLTVERSAALIEAGLDELWISMDGFSRESYEAIHLGSRYELILNNIRAFNATRAGTDVRLCVTFVVTPENIDQLEQINAFADENGVDEINISHEIPGHPIPEEELLYHRTEIAVGKMRRYAPATALPKEHVCPFVSSNSVFVRWDGDVVPCMQLLHNTFTYLYEQKRKITRFTYGNIAEQSLLDCWNRQDYREFRHRVNTFYFPFCTCCWGCEDREENLHDCFLGEAPTCGGCLWSTGQVFCP